MHLFIPDPFMKNNTKRQIQEIQTSMIEGAKLCFSGLEQEHLRCIIRLTGEFNNYLQNGNPQLRTIALQHSQSDNLQVPPNQLELNDLKYSIESIFSGIDSFLSVGAAYRVLVGASSSEIEWGMVPMTSLKEQFFSLYDQFTMEANFEKKCRLLLDLFKIQIVFAGVFYD